MLSIATPAPLSMVNHGNNKTKRDGTNSNANPRSIGGSANGSMQSRSSYTRNTGGVNEKDSNTEIASFRRDELVLGRLLGSGAFACVRELRAVKSNVANRAAMAAGSIPLTFAMPATQDTSSFRVIPDNDDETNVDSIHAIVNNDDHYGEGKEEDEKKELEGRDDTEDNSSRRKGPRYYQDQDQPLWLPVDSPKLTQPNRGFAVKYLKTTKQHPQPHKRIAQDLQVEIDILSSLEGQHQNLIRLHGTGHHFIVLERLVRTLTDKIQQDWSGTSILALSRSIIPGLRFSSIDTTVELEQRLLSERLQVAYDLAGALEFLHHHE